MDQILHRKLINEKNNLQLQVAKAQKQVQKLTEQIAQYRMLLNEAGEGAGAVIASGAVDSTRRRARSIASGLGDVGSTDIAQGGNVGDPSIAHVFTSLQGQFRASAQAGNPALAHPEVQTPPAQMGEDGIVGEKPKGEPPADPKFGKYSPKTDKPTTPKPKSPKMILGLGTKRNPRTR